MIQREIFKKKIAKLQAAELEYLNKKIDSVIKSTRTDKCDINQFPEVQSYLDKSFPDIDLGDVEMYLTSPNVMSRYGFTNCAGCYIPHRNVILCKKQIKMRGEKKLKDAFYRALQEKLKCDVEVDDVIVHELIHAVSHKAGRSGNKFTFGEEEFVYTNCVDFYKEKGMSNEEIVCGTFLPFCVNDVMSDYNEMCKIWGITEMSPPTTDEEVRALSSRDISIITTEIVKVAKKRAHKMIDLYEKYGRQVVLTSAPPSSDVGLRIKTLDMDCDF